MSKPSKQRQHSKPSQPRNSKHAMDLPSEVSLLIAIEPGMHGAYNTIKAKQAKQASKQSNPPPQRTKHLCCIKRAVSSLLFDIRVNQIRQAMYNCPTRRGKSRKADTILEGKHVEPAAQDSCMLSFIDKAIPTACHVKPGTSSKLQKQVCSNYGFLWACTFNHLRLMGRAHIHLLQGRS